MVGIVTRNEPELSWSGFDRAFYEQKSASGRASESTADGINTLACFADDTTIRDRPELAARSRDGQPATSEHPTLDQSYVCPTHESYREGLLKMIGDAGRASGDVRLDDIGFPRAEFCHCERCDRRFAASEYADRPAWRASVVTDFVAAARERVPGDLLVGLFPDPYPAHLYERSGIDLEALEPMVEEFVVPLYDTSYGTTYWLESIASGFADRLDARVSVELYAGVEIDPLLAATAAVEPHADAVLYGYDASTARAAIRRRNADSRGGVTHRPDDV
ncbi:hypothetical protein [Halapricum hydrolyticum]|uniref:Uncharacterized protein n=1 Tax=Halapricum hydrolyticum TaxID=2979991 RepID=A0AAE3I8I7_9EURY|nr:hypothetical protein [Halapricum hydrolyticum]MCU4716757.1 hypothetical protein [Halapricum hydrolyticum]MCU4725638.1 hypothetical protein [Halapricum hydrolyticum]